MNEHILVVEDEEAIRMALSDRLRTLGYVVEVAADGDIGFQKATSTSFDLMIFDIILPHRTGLDLCRDVRNFGIEAPVMLLSAYHQTIIKTTGFEVGADDYVTKPFDMAELNARVEALLRRPRTSSLCGRCLPHRTPVKSENQDRGRLLRPAADNESTMRSEGRRDLSRLAEVIPRLRQMLEQEHHTPQRRTNAEWLGVAEGVVEFLEELFTRVGTLRRTA